MIFTKQTEVARHFCKKLYSFFIYYEIDTIVETNIINPLAQIFINSNWEIKPVIKTLLSSEHFFDLETYGSQIKSPVDFVCGFVKEIELPLPDNTNIELQYKIYLELSAYMVIMRQSPYSPPSVSGWEAYYQLPLMHENWITTDTIGKRNQITTGLIFGYKKNGYDLKADILNITESMSDPSNPITLITDVMEYFHTLPAEPDLKDYLKSILLNNLSQDYEWSNPWNTYMADKTNVTNKTLVYNRLLLFYKHIFELAEYQLM